MPNYITEAGKKRKNFLCYADQTDQKRIHRISQAKDLGGNASATLRYCVGIANSMLDIEAKIAEAKEADEFRLKLTRELETASNTAQALWDQVDQMTQKMLSGARAQSTLI